MATNIYYHFDSEEYSDLLYKTFINRNISDEAINNLLTKAEDTINNVISFEEEALSNNEEITCLSEEDNNELNALLSDPFLDVYFVNGNVNNVVNGNVISVNDVTFSLVEKNNKSFELLKDSSIGNTAIFVVDSREMAPLFDRNNGEEIQFSNSYMFGYYDQQTGSIVKNLNFKSRNTFDGKKDISYESYLGDYSLPISSENGYINELYKKLYSLEVLFSKYVDEIGFNDLKNQIKYYASSIIMLKQSISDEMVMSEARLSENYEEEFVL